MYAVRPLLAAGFIFLTLGGAQSQEYRFKVLAEGTDHPIIRGTTNLQAGTTLLLILKKPLLPDAQQRIARGLSACEDGCSAPSDSVIVKQGSFASNPFSFDGKPIKAGAYPLEIWLPVRPGETLDQLRSTGRLKPIFTTTVQVLGQNNVGDPQSISTQRNESDSAEAIYRSRFFVAGSLLRAGDICPNGYKELVDAAFDMLDAPELKRLSGAFPETTQQWMLEGATSLNTGVMHDGIEKTCADVEHMRAKAAQMMKPSR